MGTIRLRQIPEKMQSEIYANGEKIGIIEISLGGFIVQGSYIFIPQDNDQPTMFETDLKNLINRIERLAQKYA